MLNVNIKVCFVNGCEALTQGERLFWLSNGFHDLQLNFSKYKFLHC